MRHFTLLLLNLALLSWAKTGFSQSYLYAVGNAPVGFSLGYIDLATCTYCEEFQLPVSSFLNSGLTDVVPLNNGNVVGIGFSGDIKVFNPPSATPISTLNLPVSGLISISGGVLDPSGNVIITGVDFVAGDQIPKVWVFNPVTNTATLVGTGAPNSYFLDEPFYWNGALHCFGTEISPSNTFGLLTFSLTNPLTISLVNSLPSACGAPSASIVSGPFTGIYSGVLDPSCDGTEVFEVDYDDLTATSICNISPNDLVYGLGSVPPGYPPPPSACACTTDAGEITTANQTLCANEDLNFINENTALQPGDLLQFILSTNPANLTGSIIATSNTPDFSFTAPLQTGVTYYVTAIAGNGVGGDVDLNDPCLDLSNSIQVVWSALPAVSFSLAPNQVCAGICQNIQVSLTGAQPFSLVFETSAGATQSQTFTTTSGVIQVCPPSGFTGDFTISATSLSDANCVCN